MAGIIDKIPRMTVRQTMDLWRNAILICANPKKRKIRAEAEAVLRAIQIDWTRKKLEQGVQGSAFRWPTTDANPGTGGIASQNWLEEGVLKEMGYQVGSAAGISKPARERILAEVFSGPLPPAFPLQHLEEWGEPLSPKRLHKMAECIAAFARNANRRRDSKMSNAIRDWESDLEFLHDEYYVGKFWFAWPTTSVL